MVEMAIVLPLLIMLVFGTIHFGIAFNRLQAFHAAAREGARTASIPSNDYGDVSSAVTAAMVGITDEYDAPSVDPGGCDGRRGDPVTVEVVGTYTISIPLLPNVDIDLTGRGVFRCE